MQDNANLLFLHLVSLRELFVFYGVRYSLKYKSGIFHFFSYNILTPTVRLLLSNFFQSSVVDGYFIPS